MEKTKYGLAHRIAICLALFFAALGCVSLANAQPVTQGSFSKTTAGFGAWYFSGGAKFGTTGSNMVPLTTTATNPLNLSGWTTAGNFGMAPSATGVTYNAQSIFNVPGSGKTVPVNMTGKFNPASMGTALAKFARKVGPLATGMAIYELLDDLNIGCIWNTTLLQNDCTATTTGSLIQYTVSSNVSGSTWVDANKVASSCSDAVARAFGGVGSTYAVEDNQFRLYTRKVSALSSCGVNGPPYTGTLRTDTTCVPRAGSCGGSYSVTPFTEGGVVSILQRTAANSSTAELTEETLANKIAQESGWPTTSTIATALKQAIESGQEVKLDAPPAASCPTSDISGPVTSTTNADGTVTTSAVTYQITCTGDTINWKTKTTTTTPKPDGSTETTEETKEGEPPKEDSCTTKPDSVGCAELDSPTGEIPKRSETITYTEESLFGSGSCPADVMATLGTLHQTVKVWDWQKTCQYALPLRAMIVALATFAAFLIVMPGSTHT